MAEISGAVRFTISHPAIHLMLLHYVSPSKKKNEMGTFGNRSFRLHFSNFPCSSSLQCIVTKLQTRKQTGTLSLSLYKAVMYLECSPFLEKERDGGGPIAPMCPFVVFLSKRHREGNDFTDYRRGTFREVS